jgi:hypothetical protein
MERFSRRIGVPIPSSVGESSGHGAYSGEMPELPFVTVLIENLQPKVEGRTIVDVIVRSVYVLKTADPPIASLTGRRIEHISRRGKLLVFHLTDGLVMVMHLRRNGRLQVFPRGKARTAKDLAITLMLDDGNDLRLIEVGPKKAASLWVFPAGQEAGGKQPGSEALAGLGIEPLTPAFTRDALAAMLREARTHLKRFQGGSGGSRRHAPEGVRWHAPDARAAPPAAGSPPRQRALPTMRDADRRDLL